MKRFYTFLVGLVLVSPVFGQSDMTVSQSLMRDELGTPKYLRINDAVVIGKDEALNWLREELKMTDAEDLILLNKAKDNIGFEHYKYQFTLAAVPVEGAVYSLHFKNERLQSCSGYYVKGIVPANSSLSEEAALSSALAYFQAQHYMWEDEAEEALLREHKGANATYYPKGKLVYLTYGVEETVLCYKFDIYAQAPLKREDVYVDAITGQIVKAYGKIHDVNVPGVAVTKYSDTVNIITDSLGIDSFVLRDHTRGADIITYDLNESTNHGNGVDFVDTDNFWDNFNSNQDEVATDAHWGAEMTWDYFFGTHGRNSYDDLGSPMLSYVHYGVNFANAFWDGQRMTYGDGSNPFLTLDVVGHEFSHGVTGNTAGLIYAFESGALNESFSDIFGATVNFFARGSDANWLIGPGLSQFGGALRNMANPNQYNDPDTYLGQNYYIGAQDNGGVHTNSGVQNFWYYLLCEGGSGINDNADSYSVDSIGIDSAGQIAYRNLSVYLTPNSNYQDARDFSIIAARDIYGICSKEERAVADAWHAVGIGEPADTSITASFISNLSYACQVPVIVAFTGTSTGADQFLWNFGDGGQSTFESPTHIFNTEGTFTVQMIATGTSVCLTGSDSTTMDIQIVALGKLPEPLCEPQTNSHSGEYGIYKVELNTISYESADGVDGYQDYTCETNTILNKNLSYPIYIRTNPDVLERVKVWIDYNNDTQFDEVTELVFNPGPKKADHFGTIAPVATPVMNTPLRMRVASDIPSNNTLNSCDNVSKGQAEDYSVLFVDSGTYISSVKDVKMNSVFNLFPNPSTGLITLSYNENLYGAQIRVFDGLGRQVLAEAAQNGGQQLDLSHLSNGTYYISVQNTHGISSEVFIISK